MAPKLNKKILETTLRRVAADIKTRREIEKNASMAFAAMAQLKRAVDGSYGLIEEGTPSRLKQEQREMVQNREVNLAKLRAAEKGLIQLMKQRKGIRIGLSRRWDAGLKTNYRLERLRLKRLMVKIRRRK